MISQLDEAGLALFTFCSKRVNTKEHLSERYFFIRGIRLAIMQLNGIAPDWLDSGPVDFEGLFDDTLMDRLCDEKTPAVSREDMDRLRIGLKDDVWDELEQNKYDMSCNLRCALLLSGYLLAIRFMQQTCIGFQENVHFTKKLITAISDYLQEYAE